MSSDDDFTIDEAIAFGQGRWSEVPLHKCEGGHEEIKGVARQLADEIERLRGEVADLTASGLALCDESDAFRANLAAERALADQLAEALRDACDIRPFISVWQEAQKALTAYEEARCGW